ncbi:MAG: MFS transporter [Acidobacteriota bacterium]|nr:MFS transporter [Acidobacteriota bacterium]
MSPRWVVLVLLVISVCINYIDRGNLGVAGVTLSRELHLQPDKLGYLLSAFFWTYAVCQLVAGWLVERYNVLLVYAVGYFLWSLATACTGLVHGFEMLFLLRLLLGISESVAYPSYSKIIASAFHERQRGIANALVDAGSKLGPAFGLLVGGTILSLYGWRWLFLGVGLVSMLWLIPWVIAAPKLHAESTHTRAEGPGYLKILTKRDAWASFLALFCANYAWYFLLTWLPGYLQLERLYSTQKMALLGSLPFFLVAAGSVIGGSISDAWIRRGASPTLVRKTFVCGGCAGCAVFLLPSAMVTSQTLSMVLLSIACFCMGFFSSNLWAITQTLAGPAAAGKWTGAQNCIGNLAGVVAPSLTGLIVTYTHSFFLAFVCVSAVLLVAAFSFLVLMGRVEPVRWASYGPEMGETAAGGGTST